MELNRIKLNWTDLNWILTNVGLPEVWVKRISMFYILSIGFLSLYLHDSTNTLLLIGQSLFGMFKANVLHWGLTHSEAISVVHASETHCMLHYIHGQGHDLAIGRTFIFTWCNKIHGGSFQDGQTCKQKIQQNSFKSPALITVTLQRNTSREIKVIHGDYWFFVILWLFVTIYLLLH